MQLAGLNQTATVYTPDETDGSYTVEDRSSLKCRLANKGGFSRGDGNERDERWPNRLLMWEVAYTMPDNAQVEVNGVRWNVIPDTATELYNLDGNVVYRRCEVAKDG